MNREVKKKAKMFKEERAKLRTETQQDASPALEQGVQTLAGRALRHGMSQMVHYRAGAVDHG
jgi:hypothetical protein